MQGLPSPSAHAASTARIRPLAVADLAQLLRVFSDATPAVQLGRTVYSAPGCEAYLAQFLAHAAFHAHERIWGVELDGEGLVGAAHARQVGKNLHLSHCAVLPSFQRLGLGARLLEHGQGFARSMGLRRLSLDVALENEGARRHYARQGFVEQAQTYEHRLLITPAPADTQEVRLQDWPQAQAAFLAYGFASFAFTLGNERHPVEMRLGEFRLGSQDPRLLHALWTLDPTCTILLRTTTRLESPDWAPSGTWVRMMKELI